MGLAPVAVGLVGCLRASVWVHLEDVRDRAVVDSQEKAKVARWDHLARVALDRPAPNSW